MEYGYRISWKNKGRYFRLNITGYQTVNEYQVYFGKASLKENFYIVNADERFYHLVGKKSGFPIPELHPELF